MDPAKKQQEPEQEAPEASLDDVISSAFDDMESEGETPETSKPDEPEVAEAPVETAEVAAPPEQAVVDYNESAPQRWPHEIAEIYNTLPPAAKQAMMEGFYKPMQRQYTQATQELAEQRRAVEPMYAALARYRGDFERSGIDPTTAFVRQMEWSAHLAQVGPEQGLRDMAKSYGVTLGQDPQQQEEYLTPTERQLKQQIEQLSGFAQQQQLSNQQAQEQQQQQAWNNRVAEVQSGLQAFTNETNEDGFPAHPHVEALAPVIAGLIREKQVSDTDMYGRPIHPYHQITAAYNMAMGLAQKVNGAAPTQSGQVARARAAQSVGVVTKLPPGKSGPSGKSIEEDIDNLYDNLARRVS